MILEDKVIWVTGASRGIGRAIALACGHQGARLVLTARSVEHLAETADALSAADCPQPLLLDYDLTDPAQIGSAFSKVQRETKRLDALVNNAGVMHDAVIGMISAAQIEETFAVNVFAALHHLQYAARLMSRAQAGSIVNVASIIGRVGNAGQLVYGASKGALIAATLSASKELAPKNIRVNALAPGFIDTDMARQLSPENFEARRQGIGMGRIGTTAEVADAALFLVSDLSRYVTGEVLGVDGAMLV